MSDKVIKFRKDSTQIYNYIIRNSKDVEIIGLYTIIQHCIDLQEDTKGTDKEFKVSKKGIQSYTGYSDTKFQRIWNKLKESGYLKQLKISKGKGEFEYVYELLEEPNKKLYHSLVQKGKKIENNIPENKKEKMIKKSDDLTHKIVKSKSERTIENTTIQSHISKLSQGEKVGGYNNTRNNKLVCMYLEKASQYFELLEEHEMLIGQFKKKISFDLFEVLLNETVNKNKHVGYFLSAVKRQIENSVFILEQYKAHKLKFNQSFVNTKKASKYVQAIDNSHDSRQTNSSKNVRDSIKRTRFHNFEETFTQYSEDEFERIIQNSQKAKFGG